MRLSAIASILLASVAVAVPVNLNNRVDYDGPFGLQLGVSLGDPHGFTRFWVIPYKLKSGKIITTTSDSYSAEVRDYYYTRVWQRGELGINSQNLIAYDDQGFLAWAYGSAPNPGPGNDQSPLKGLWADGSYYISRTVNGREEKTWYSCDAWALGNYIDKAIFWHNNWEAKRMFSEIPEDFPGRIVLSIEVGDALQNKHNVEAAKEAGCKISVLAFASETMLDPPHGLN